MMNLRGKASRAIGWNAMQRFATQAAGFIVTLIMARMLTPADYGLVGMLVVVIEIAQALTDSGLSQALVRCSDAEAPAAASAIFRYNLIVALILYVGIFFAAPVVSDFYAMPELTGVLRLLAIVIPLRASSAVKIALLSRNLEFKAQSVISFVAALVSGAIGIAMAAAGFGVMAIVGQQLAGALLTALSLWLFTSWNPAPPCGRERFRSLFGFGSKLLASALLEVAYRNLYLILIGKFYRAAELGNFTRARQFASLPSVSAGEIIRGVSYPLLCRLKDDEEGMRRAVGDMISLCAYAIFPVMTAIAIFAEPLILTLLGPKWIEAAGLLPYLSIGMMMYPIDVVNLSAIQASGDSRSYLKAEVWKKILGLCLLGGALAFGVKALCVSYMLVGLGGSVINALYARRSCGVKIYKQIKRLGAIILLSLGSVTAGAVICAPLSQPWMQLGVGVGVCGLLYAAISHTVRMREYDLLRMQLRAFGKSGKQEIRECADEEKLD